MRVKTDVDREPPYDEMAGCSVIDEPNNTVMPVAGPCGDFDCGRTTTRRCSHCSGAWFCSVKCEERAEYSHRFSCNRRPITTADLLEKDCYRDLLPQDPEVREDYGFQRCKNTHEETKLFGLYIGIFKYHDISSEELHRWRTEGILVEKIIEVFSKLPEGSRGGYYPWFLCNRHVIEGDQEVVRDEDDPEKYLQERYDEARTYLDPSDQAKALEDLTPFAKQYCFFFLALLLDCKHPPPQMERLDLWYDFGFVVCSDEHQETTMANHYHWLLLGNKAERDHFKSLQMDHLCRPSPPTCSFTDFWTAWEAGSLMELFGRYGTSRGADSYGVSLDRSFPALREFLSYPGKSPRPAVWRLKQFIAIEDANFVTVPPEIAAAALEYGFAGRMNTRTRLDLHDFYTRIFQRSLLPGELDEARRKRNMHEMADQWYGSTVNERVKNVLRNVPDVTLVDLVGDADE